MRIGSLSLAAAALLALACRSRTAATDVHASTDTPGETPVAEASAAPDLPPPPLPMPGRQPVEVDMRNVDLHVAPRITLGIRHLRGRFIGTGKSGIPYLDDKDSYVVVIDTGEIAMSLRALNALTGNVLGGDHSNIDDLRLSTDEGRLVQKGEIDKKLDIPFKVKGELSATPDGRIRIHAGSVRAFGLPVKRLMKLFSLEMDDLVEVQPGRGVVVDGNDMILDPAKVLPSPHMRGKVTRVRIEGNSLIQTFGSGEVRSLSPPAVSPNHIYWKGGELMFGKLMMSNTDLELVDEDPKDAFDFSADRWNDQLVAGYSKNTPSRGLKAHMPDYSDLRRQ
jgi:hypothetical protein